jgi:hypothetical protein
MMTHDPVLEALGLSQQAGNDMMYTGTSFGSCEDQAWQFSLDSAARPDHAWFQAQALATVAWRLQQAASLQAQVAVTCGAHQAYANAPIALPVSSLTPRAVATKPMEMTPSKISDASTELGSPIAGDSEGDEDNDVVAAKALQAWLAKEVEGASSNLPPPPPPIGMPPTKLDLHALVFENAKDPVSAGLLQLIKGDGKQKGQEILDVLKSETCERRMGPLASGAHRKAAAAARAAAAKCANDDVAKNEGHRRRRARGSRGGREGRPITH